MSYRLAASLLIALAGATAAAQESASPPNGPSFRELLTDEGIVAPLEAEFKNWRPPLTAAQLDLVSRVLFRLDQIDHGDLRAAVAPLSRAAGAADIGGLFSAGGRATTVTTVDGPQDAAAPPFWRVTVETSNGPITVLSRDVPRAWRERSAERPLAEAVRLNGVLAGFSDEGDARGPLLLTNRLAWFPADGVNAGVAWLARQGLDVALLDAVRHGRAFVKNDDGREARAFYATLAAVAAGNPAELLALARDSIAEQAGQWQQQATASQSSRDRTMAMQVAQRAEKGVSSVWPLFLEPAGRVGQPVLIEGAARRAVRVLVDDGPPGLDSYYELDVFTADSQNQPVICCVARLPAGFPTGDAIREPVRVAGVFFKTWAYARRADASDEAADVAPSNPLPKRLAPPLIIAAEPVWLPTTVAANHTREIWIGAAIAAVLAAVWFALARTARRDRLARSRRARYDEPLESLD